MPLNRRAFGAILSILSSTMRHWRLFIAVVLWAASAALWIPILGAVREAEAISASVGYALLLLLLPATAIVVSVWAVWHLRR